LERMDNVGIKAKVAPASPLFTIARFVNNLDRTVTILFILHLLFDIKPEGRAKSHVGLSVLPLPAHKQLWQAAGEEEWTQEYDQMLSAREGRSYLRYQDLIDLGKGKITGERIKDTNAWITSVDAFGTLLIMAAMAL
jgi:hypothetical protein